MIEMNPVEIDPVDVKERNVDPQGRVSVGTDYSGETVRVAVIETVDQDPRINPPSTCANCGDGLGSRFTVEDGEALCLPCGGVSEDSQ
jgi:formylmethanofuran dehydrogenase subunit E